MSRCFPYPPPGFTKKASDVSTLMDSIRLQKENKANKEKRKEKRRDKGENDNKREKKEKKESVDSKQTKVAHGAAHKDGRNWTQPEGALSQKRKLDEAEQLEGSSVTEEHGQPLNLQNPSYSSDATQNINKRRKQASVASDSRGDGNIIQQSDVKEQPCSTTGRNEMPNQQIGSGSGCTDLPFVYPVSRASQGDASLTSITKNHSLQGFPSCPSSNGFCSTSGNVDDSAQGSCFTSQDKKMLEKMISKYDSLVRILYQMAVPSEVADSGGEDWLFGGKHSDTAVKKRNVEKQLPVNSRVTCCSGSSSLYPLYPRARYLEEAKIYALPYTVPF